MSIVSLGWGSLIWAPRELACDPDWSKDGPELPVEYARESSHGRVTLVLVEGAKRNPVLWSALKAGSLGDAVKALAEREGCSEQEIGRWPSNDPGFPYSTEIGTWAKAKNIDGVVWTAMPPGFSKKRGIVPTVEEVLKYLRQLPLDQRGPAKEYIERTPRQIETEYRQALEKELGINLASVSVSFESDPVPLQNLAENDNLADSPVHAFLERLAKSLPEKEGLDSELAAIVSKHILSPSPAKDGVDSAWASIQKLAEARASVQLVQAND